MSTSPVMLNLVNRNRIEKNPGGISEWASASKSRPTPTGRGTTPPAVRARSPLS